MSEEIRVESVGDAHVAVCLAAPQRANALTAGMVCELTDTLVEAAADPNVRTVTLRGDGRHFCGGFDLASVQADDDPAVTYRFLQVQRLLEVVATIPAMTIAAVHGAAFGAGGDLALACDFRLGTAAARFAFPGYRFDLALGTARLVDVVGRHAALDLLMTGRPLEAKEAEHLGILTQLLADDTAMDSALQHWRDMASGLPLESLARLLDNVRFEGLDQGFANLARSAARPELSNRLAQYATNVATGN
jgi:enoyl-CoA hydratase/carnithine racemase